MSKLSYAAFQQAFHDVLRFEEDQLADGRPRSMGAADGVGLELIRTGPDTDSLDSASLQFAHSGKDADFDQLSINCTVIFLSVLLGDAQKAQEWLTPALKRLSSPNVSSDQSDQDGFHFELLQIKPAGMFLLTARPS